MSRRWVLDEHNLLIIVMFFDPRHQNVLQISIDFHPSFDETRRHNSAVTCNFWKKKKKKKKNHDWCRMFAFYHCKNPWRSSCNHLRVTTSTSQFFRWFKISGLFSVLMAFDFAVSNILACNKISFSNFFFWDCHFAHISWLPILSWISEGLLQCFVLIHLKSKEFVFNHF